MVHWCDATGSGIKVLCFTRVIFGVSVNPFLVNATIDHHMKKLESTYPDFVSKFHRSVYVDDIVTGAADVEGAYKFIFTLYAPENQQKWARITWSETIKWLVGDRACINQEVFGVTWDITNDMLRFKITDVASLIKDSHPTKRNVISRATRFYDPLEVISPITVYFNDCARDRWGGMNRSLETSWRNWSYSLPIFNSSLLCRYLGSHWL